MKEIWRNVKGYEGLYEVSNLEWSDKIQPYRKNLCERHVNYIKENVENLSISELASMFSVNERTIKMYLNETT